MENIEKTKLSQDTEIIERAWNDLDILVLDLMQMCQSDNGSVLKVGLDALEKARVICKQLNKLKKDLGISQTP